MTALGLVLSVVACVQAPPPEQELVDTQSVNQQCGEPRPQVCTLEYAPVCATLASGVQAQYSSPCNACAHDAVSEFALGTCPLTP